MGNEVDINRILQVAIKGGASDIHLKAGLPPMFRVDGNLLPLRDSRRLTPEDLSRIAVAVMNPAQKDIFKETCDVDLAYGLPGVGRFRVNVFQQRGSVGMVFRVIPFKVKTLKELLLPPVLTKIAAERRGLVLVTGATGSGKSTTLAALIEEINQRRTCHVMTVEDPIEFMIRDKRSIVNQREVGTDTLGFSQALRAALRQDPDVILVGEMRDRETIEIAMTAAETGHLVLSTLHTVDATETISRIIGAFPPHQQKHVRGQLAGLLKAVVSQRLIARANGRGRVAALEILTTTGFIKELILNEDRTLEIPEAIAKGHVNYGMQTFDQALLGLLNSGYVTYDEALAQSSNPDDFALRVSGVEGASGGGDWGEFESKGGGTREIDFDT